MANVIVNGLNFRCTACGRIWRGEPTHTCAEPDCPADVAVPERDIDFASDEAGELALELGLTLDDFDGYVPSGKTGLTVADVSEVAKILGIEVD